MSIDKKSIAEKLTFLKEVCDKLDEIVGKPKDEFFNDFYVSDSAMRNLEVGIEAIVDIGNHILVSSFSSSEKAYRDVLVALGEKKVVPIDFAEKNAEMADFRNLLAHGYGRVDLLKVYRYLQKAPTVFRDFSGYFVKFLESQE
jgi:uncharacterized protein YutE (UPF0331/DUF86 family)